MDVRQILEWTDRLVLTKTGKHLNSLQQAVLAGVWQSRKYKEIAEDYRCSEANVKKTAKRLWYLLSEELGETVNKSNFRATMERYQVSNLSNIGNVVKSNFVRSHINLCGESFHAAEGKKKRSTANPDKVKPKKQRDLTHAPATTDLYNRTQELTTLQQWLLEENSRIIALMGLPGIGKTALARQLVEQIADKYDNILWRNHRKFPTFQSLKTNLIQFLSPEQPAASIVDKLSLQRTLIVLDDLHTTFTSGELAGTYRPDYQNYGELLQDIAESPHNSCLLLLTREKPSESEKIAIAYLTTQEVPVAIARKPKDFPFSQSAFWKAVRSLTRRCLVEKVTADGVSKFRVGAAIAQFVKEQNP